MENPLLTKTSEVLMYGDRVKFFWKDSDGECILEGLYAGPHKDDPKEAVVTVVTPGQYRGKVINPYIWSLERIEHPALETAKKAEKKLYDKITLEKMRDNIIDNFQFDRVHIAMLALEWEWWDCGIPTIEILVNEGKRLLDTVIEDHITNGRNRCIVSTGGFEASLEICEDGIPDMSLRFMVDDWYEGGDCWKEYEEDFDKRNNKKRKRKRTPKRNAED